MNAQLKTDRLTLRRPNKNDVPRMVEYLADFDVSGNLSTVPHPYEEIHAHQWLERVEAGNTPSETKFAIDLEYEGYVGEIGFYVRDEKPIIGYWLGKPFWGRGIMTEALSNVLGWYFDNAEDDTIYSGVFHFNMASLVIQQKLGFVETGRSMVHCVARGKDIEHIDTELSRDAIETYNRRAGAFHGAATWREEKTGS